MNESFQMAEEARTMGFADYKKDLIGDDFNAYFILDRYFHSGESVVFHGAPREAEAELKKTVATELHGAFGDRVHPFQLVICGSAHLGFSPVPGKLGQPFDPKRSDIDISVVSPELFERWWAELQSSGLEAELREIVSRDLFWGFINPANVREVSEMGRQWWNSFGQIQTDRAKGVRGRLYKNFWSMQSYHRQAIFAGRNELLAQASLV